MEGEVAVGRRVRVFWEGEGEWFKGVVAAFSPESGYFVRYDDGEEQWEDAGDTLVFLPNPSDEDAGTNAEAGEPAMPSPSYSQQELEDDGDDGDDDRDAVDAVTADQESHNERYQQQSSSSSPQSVDPVSLRSSSDAAGSVDRQGQRRLATARALKGGGAAFFRDEDTLREMKRALEAEKRELMYAKTTLEMQLASRESESAAIKRELQQLKTQVSLVSALHYVSSSSSASPSSTPTTAVEWKQRVFDLKLGNQQLQHDIVELKTACQFQQRSVDDQQQRVEQLRAKVAHVPQRELLTLSELQVAIAELLQRKRELEATARTTNKATVRNQRLQLEADDGDNQESRTALEKQLARLELSLTQSQEDARAWRTRLECERARLQPMRERLEGLRSELLSQYHSDTKRGDGKSVLLRSLFLRLDGDGDGVVDRTAAIEAIELVLGRSAEAERPEAFTAAKTDDDSLQLSFDQFVDAYRRLVNSSATQ